LRPLFGGLLKSLKLFAAGLKGAIVGFLPFLAIAALVVLALGGLYLMLKKAQEFFGKDDPGESGLGGSQDTDLPMETPVADENDFSSRVQRRAIVDQETKEIIQPDDPRYDKIYERDRGIPAPVQGQVYMGDGQTAILPLSSDGKVNPFELRNMKPEDMKLKPNELLKPVDTSSESKNQASIVDGSVKTINNNATYTGTGLNGARDRDLELFHMAHPLYAS